MAASTCADVTNFEARVDVITDGCSRGACSGVRDSDCGNGYRFVWKSEMGQEYFVLVYKATNLPGSLFGLSIENFEPAENDFCQDAIPLELNAGIVKGTTLTATHDQLERGQREDLWERCKLQQNSQPGVWYRVTGTGAKLLASTCNDETDFASQISVFRGGCDQLYCVPSSVQFCSEKGSVYWDSVAGEEYLIFIHGADYGASANIGKFGLEVSEFVTEPNDSCDGAIAVNATGATVQSSTFAATLDNVASCSGFDSDAAGVWYKVIGTGEALRAATCDPATNFDTLISIYQGSCGNLVCVIADDNSCGIQSSVKWTALEGVTYYIYVHGRQASSVGDFALLVEEFTPTVRNDFCDGAFAVSSAGGLTLGSTSNATFDNAASCTVSNSAPGVWYKVRKTGTRMFLYVFSNFDRFFTPE